MHRPSKLETSDFLLILQADWVTVFSRTTQAIIRRLIWYRFLVMLSSHLDLGRGALCHCRFSRFFLSFTPEQYMDTFYPNAFWLQVYVRNVFLAWSDALPIHIRHDWSANLARSTGPLSPQWRRLKYLDALQKKKKSRFCRKIGLKSGCCSCHESYIQSCCLYPQKRTRRRLECVWADPWCSAMCRTPVTFACVAIRCRWKCMRIWRHCLVVHIDLVNF